jgi:hypothetical protein
MDHLVNSGTAGDERYEREIVMRVAAATAFLILAGAMSAVADEMPVRKAGLWEIRTIRLEVRTKDSNSIAAPPPRPFRQCTNAATDAVLMLWTGLFTSCPARDVRRSGDVVTIDSTCTIGNKTEAAHTTITGSFDSNYTMMGIYTMSGGDVPAGWAELTGMKELRWLGPCAEGQKPGDIIRDDGHKFNVLEMEKPGSSQDALPR